MINRYVALDIETTGLNPAVDRIIEVGMARVEDGQIRSDHLRHQRHHLPHRAGPLLLPWAFGQARGVAVPEMAGGGGVAVHPQDGRLSGKDGAGVPRCRKEPLFLHQRHKVVPPSYGCMTLLP